MTWWAWMILGAVLFGAELFAIDAQFYLVFLGLSAAIVGLAGVFGIALPEWIQWLAFAALSLVSMFTFRRSLYDKIRGNVPGFKEGVAGEHLVVQQDLPVGSQSRASFRGSDWTIVNDGPALIKGGSRVKITRSEGLTLHVKDDPT
jgi:membrane protein implicated in regulation of membrane protease activity